MNEDKSHIDKLFQEVDNASIHFDKSEMWKDIESNLDNKRKKRRIIFWWVGAASVLLLIGFFSGYFFATSEKTPTVAEATPSASTQGHGASVKIKPPSETEDLASKTEEMTEENSSSAILSPPSTSNITSTTPSSDAGKLPMTLPAQEEKMVEPLAENGFTNEANTAAIRSSAPVLAQTSITAHSEQEVTPVSKQEEPGLSIPRLNASDFMSHPRFVHGLEMKQNTSFTPYPTSEDLTLDQPPTRSLNKWSAGGSVSPGFGSVELKDEFLAFQDENVENSVDMNSIAAELQLGYQLSKKWSVVSGVSYFQWKGDNTALIATTSTTVSNGSGYTDINNPDSNLLLGAIETTTTIDSVASDISISAFEVPVIFRFNVINRKSNVFVTSGVSTNWFIEYKNESRTTSSNAPLFASSAADTELDRERSGVAWDNAQVNFIVSFGVEYPLLKQLEVRVEPHYRRGILSGKGSELKSPFSGMGLRTGLLYRF